MSGLSKEFIIETIKDELNVKEVIITGDRDEEN